MAWCRGCAKQICSCPLSSGESTLVMGNGGSAAPYEVRLKDPGSSVIKYRYAGHALQTDGGQLFQANTDTRINFDADALASLTGGNMWSPAQPNRLTAPIDGQYLISAMANRTDEGTWNIWVVKNGVVGSPLVKRSTALPSGPTGALVFLSVMTLVRLNANDYIELYIRSNTLSIVIGVIAEGSLIGVDCCPYLAAQWVGV